MECEFHINIKKQAGEVCWQCACALLTRRDCKPDRALAGRGVQRISQWSERSVCSRLHLLMTAGQQINPHAKKKFMSDMYILPVTWNVLNILGFMSVEDVQDVNTRKCNAVKARTCYWPRGPFQNEISHNMAVWSSLLLRITVVLGSCLSRGAV